MEPQGSLKERGRRVGPREGVRQKRRSSSEREDAMPLALEAEEGTVSPGVQVASELDQARRNKRRSGFYPSRRNAALPASRFEPREARFSCEPHTCELIHACCFKPLSLQKFVTAATGN